LIVAWLLAASSESPAWADVVILANGDHVSGELQVSELQVVTPENVVRLEPAALAGVTLGTVSGDVVELRTGRTITGLVVEATYAIRLESGQTIVLTRHQVAELHFRPRR
jgi:methyl coenzyme M reductase subunit C